MEQSVERPSTTPKKKKKRYCMGLMGEEGGGEELLTQGEEFDSDLNDQNYSKPLKKIDRTFSYPTE